MKSKGNIYKCTNKYCKTKEFIPEREFGLTTLKVKSVLCPICLCPRKRCPICRGSGNKCKGHQFKMEKIEE